MFIKYDKKKMVNLICLFLNNILPLHIMPTFSWYFRVTEYINSNNKKICMLLKYLNWILLSLKCQQNIIIHIIIIKC